MFGLIEELIFEIQESVEGGGILGEFAGEGVERFFGGVAAGEAMSFGLEEEGAFGAVLFFGAEEKGSVFGEGASFDFAAGNLAKGFLAEGGEDGVGKLAGAAADEVDEGVGFLGGAVDAFGPAFLGVGFEKLVDLPAGGAGAAVFLEAFEDDFVVGTFPEVDEEVFLLGFREGEEGAGL
jgi:hypothetical protein